MSIINCLRRWESTWTASLMLGLPFRLSWAEMLRAGKVHFWAYLWGCFQRRCDRIWEAFPGYVSTLQWGPAEEKASQCGQASFFQKEYSYCWSLGQAADSNFFNFQCELNASNSPETTQTSAAEETLKVSSCCDEQLWCFPVSAECTRLLLSSQTPTVWGNPMNPLT